MQHYFLEEDDLGNLVIYAPNGTEVTRFGGEDAFERAIQWAEAQGLELRSNKNPGELQDNQRLYFRRRPRFLRLNRYNPVPQPSPDPPNVKRVVVPSEEDIDPWESGEDSPYYDDVVLAPDDEDDEEI
jgi:hypothetical protein